MHICIHLLCNYMCIYIYIIGEGVLLVSGLETTFTLDNLS